MLTTHASDTQLNIAQYAKNPIEKTVPKKTQWERGKAIFDWFPNVSMNLPSGTGKADALAVVNIKNGTKFLYTFGEIHYLDVFNFPHSTYFCAVWVAEIGGFAPCDSYNHAD